MREEMWLSLIGVAVVIAGFLISFLIGYSKGSDWEDYFFAVNVITSFWGPIFLRTRILNWFSGFFLFLAWLIVMLALIFLQFMVYWCGEAFGEQRRKKKKSDNSSQTDTSKPKPIQAERTTNRPSVDSNELVAEESDFDYDDGPTWTPRPCFRCGLLTSGFTCPQCGYDNRGPVRLLAPGELKKS